MNTVVGVGVDDGFRSTKVAFRGADGQICMLMVDSSARNGTHYAESGAGANSTSAGLYRVDDNTITVANSLDGDSIRQDGYHTSPTNRAMLQHALRQIPGLAGKEVFVTAGLPAEVFYRAGAIDTFVIDKKTANMIGSVEVLSGDKRAIAVKWSQVIAQAVAAYIDWTVDEKLNYIDRGTQALGVADIGGSTTDALIVNDGNIVLESVVTHATGTLDLYAELGDWLKHETQVALPRRKVSEALRQGKVLVLGREVDCREAITQAISHLAPRVIDACDRAFNRGASVDRILLVGGGASYFKDALQARYGMVELAENPLYANARGMLKQAESSIAQMGEKDAVRLRVAA